MPPVRKGNIIPIGIKPCLILLGSQLQEWLSNEAATDIEDSSSKLLSLELVLYLRKCVFNRRLRGNVC